MQRAIVAGLYAALTILMTWPVGIFPAGVRMGGGADPSLYVWTIGWGAHALTHAPWAIFNANIFYPYQYTLAYSENLIGSALLAIPIMWVTGDALIATNLVAVLSVFLCAVGGYYLGRTLGLSPAASFLVGLIFAFVPPLFARLGQLHLIAVQWVPFGLARLSRYLRDGHARDLRWTIALLSLQALASGHGAALLILGGAILVGFDLARTRTLALARRVRDIGVPGLLAMLPAALAFIPYWLAKRDVPLERVHDDVGVTLNSYISSPTHLHTAILERLPDWEWLRVYPDAHLFPGIAVIVLAVLAFRSGHAGGSEHAGFGPRGNPRAEALGLRAVFLTMVIVTWWMTIGPPWSIWGYVYWLPGLNFIRVPSRFTMLGVLALAVLAGYGFDRMAHAWSQRGRRVAAAALSAVLIAEFAVMPVDVRPFDSRIAPIDHWLDSQPKPFAIAEVPVSASRDDSRRAEVATMYMLHSLAHHQPTVFGYSGAEPATYRPLYDKLIGFPSDESIRALTETGVTYVVAHLEYFTPEDRDAFLARAATFSDRLTVAHRDGLGLVYKLKQ